MSGRHDDLMRKAIDNLLSATSEFEAEGRTGNVTLTVNFSKGGITSRSVNKQETLAAA